MAYATRVYADTIYLLYRLERCSPFVHETIDTASLQHDEINCHIICIVAIAVVCIIIVGCNAQVSPGAVQGGKSKGANAEKDFMKT